MSNNIYINNPCSEIFTTNHNASFNINKKYYTDENKVAEEINKIKEKREKLLEHLIDHGWMVNYKYIELKKSEENQPMNSRKKKKSKYPVQKEKIEKEIEVDFNVLIKGEYQGDYHLISRCDNYTVRIRENYAAFWRKNKWLNLGEFPINEIELTEKGIKIEIINIEVDFNE